MNRLRGHQCPKAGHKKETHKRVSGGAALAHVLAIGPSRRTTALHFPGCLWKSILYNSLLPSRQIKGPLLKKKVGKRWRDGVMGRHVGAFIAEQSLRAVNIISERLQKENYGLFVVPPAPALPTHQCPKTPVTVDILKTVNRHT